MTEAEEYGMRVRNNASSAIAEVCHTPDGSTRSLTDITAAGVLIAQSNLAIAASIAELADVLRRKQ